MNCFPCRGPACNSCGKYDRIIDAVAEGAAVRCHLCGGRVDISSGRCADCGMLDIPQPGERPPVSRGPKSGAPGGYGGDHLQDNDKERSVSR